MKPVYSVLLFVTLTGTATCLFTKRYVYVEGSLNWADAQSYCRNNYNDLLIFDSQEEQDSFLADIYFSSHRWIGLRRKSEYDDFYWSDGSKFEFSVGKFTGSTSSDNCVYVSKSSFHVDECSVTLSMVCYYWEPQINVVQEMMTWEEALTYCRTHYTDLMSLFTDNDLNAVKSQSKSNLTNSLWIGLRFMNGEWFWLDKEALGSLTSMPTCPIRPFHCGVFKAELNMIMNNNCNDKSKFICYTVS